MDGEGGGLQAQVIDGTGDFGLARGFAVEQLPGALEAGLFVIRDLGVEPVGKAAGVVEDEGVVHQQ